ncbi:MAG: hypothetical protein QOF83_1015 [Solirubrobacteraceae bacterium]|jgi:hypothetical protein|nr:hypothetical protein [Solirubrobacteraceae bacterium]
MSVSPTVRNVLIIVVIAAVVAFAPGGGTGAGVVIQAVSLLFLGAIAFLASLMYRQHRVAIYSLGERRRAALYAAAAVLTITLTATNRLWTSSLGGVAWLILVGGAAYAGFALIWAARRE